MDFRLRGSDRVADMWVWRIGSSVSSFVVPAEAGTHIFGAWGKTCFPATLSTEGEP